MVHSSHSLCHVEELEAKVSHLLASEKCEAYLKVDITAETTSKQRRKYKNRPVREEKRMNFHLHITPQKENLAKKKQVMGWRAYATNAPPEKLSLSKAVDVYRDAYLHEHGYSRLKGKPLSLTPMYLHKDEQITGLIRLLSLALRVLTLIEFVVRKRLAEEDVYIHTSNKQWIHLKPLTITQKRILQLLGMSENVYTSLVPNFSKLLFKSVN